MTNRERLEHGVTLLSGMAIGATLMFVLDPNRGRKRRSGVQQKLVHAGHVVNRTARRQGRNLANQLSGSVAELRSKLRDRFRTIDDDTLVERVKAQLGHVISHPGLLDISCSRGCVCISGPVLDREIDRIRERLEKIRGVVETRLSLDEHPSWELERISGRRGRIPQREAV